MRTRAGHLDADFRAAALAAARRTSPKAEVTATRSLRVQREIDADASPLAAIVRSDVRSFDARGRRVSSEAEVCALELEKIKLVDHQSSAVQYAWRTPVHIRADNADYFVLSMPASSTLEVKQNGLQTQTHPGEVVLIATSKPSLAIMRGVDRRRVCRTLHVRIPGSVLRARMPGVDQLCNRKIELGRGVGQLLPMLLEKMLLEGPYLRQRQASGMDAVILELVCSIVMPVIDTLSAEVRCQPRSAIQVCSQARAYIEANLGDPALDCTRVAAHCNVSVRYLHKAFSYASSSVTTYIRERRLQNYRAALFDPLLQNRTIGSIAADWGFSDPSYLIHLYKARFGCTPRADRQQVLDRRQRALLPVR